MRTFHPASFYSSSPSITMPSPSPALHSQDPPLSRSTSPDLAAMLTNPSPSPGRISAQNEPATHRTDSPTHNAPPNPPASQPAPPIVAASPAVLSKPVAIPSIQPMRSLLSRKDGSPASGQLPAWNISAVPPPPLMPASTSALPVNSFKPDNGANGATNGNKRKFDDADPEDPQAKLRRVVREYVPQSPPRGTPMTTVICLHAAVAQKSYGSEKRFLCPPPVVHIEGPLYQMRTQQLAMSVVSENGDRSFEQKAPLDGSLTASFKFLHVNGTAKAKSFQLSLDIVEPPPMALNSPDSGEVSGGRVWAAFDSAPVTIISKPSKKTAKTRNITSCILAGGPVSLFNRINSQTVRTKYMTIDHAQLCASNLTWSAFNVNVVHRPSDAPPIAGAPQPVTYGCEIVLSDANTGISTSPLVIRKVDKGRVSADDGGPVSQMQKIALQRVNADGSRHYLSAAGPLPGTAGVVASGSGISSQAGAHPLIFQSPRVRDEMKDGVRVISDEVDDYLCWTIVGISKFQYTFFDATGQNNSLPAMPITPFPTLFTTPVYRPANNTLELTVSNFFYEEPSTRIQTHLEVYIGNIGPLQQRIYQHPPAGPLTAISPFIQPLASAPIDGASSTDRPPLAPAVSPGQSPPQSSRYTPNLHSIVIVEMPPLADIIKALKEEAAVVGPPPPPPPPHPVHAAASGTEGVDAAGARTDGALGVLSAPPSISIAGRSLPLLFIRACDGVGYHSGRTVACENVFQAMDLGNMAANGSSSNGGGIDTSWLAAAQAAAAADGGLHGWTLRVI